MTSLAFAAWRSSRLGRLDRLLAAHPDSVGSSTDPAVAEEWTHALVLRLASEFQGFCRDLHNEVAGAILDAVMLPGSDLRGTLINGLVMGRGLDRRSADPITITNDFNRLGIDVWVALGDVHPEAAPIWRESLSVLHRARNGVVHDDRKSVGAVHAAGWPLEIETVRRWRILLDEIAVAMDDVMSKDMTEQMRKNPWE